ncbi:MAG: T9SS type A sorting domain-containing protein [Bacteroidales bacterium]|nr:T9SS type A sorting domain-containing protein [Bacteroidales bacterium]
MLYEEKDIIKNEILLNDKTTEVQIENDEFLVNIYPNPTKDIINVEIDGIDTPNTIYLYNSFGQLLIKKENVVDKQLTINLQEYSKGIFFIRVNNAKHSILNKVICQ